MNVCESLLCQISCTIIIIDTFIACAVWYYYNREMNYVIRKIVENSLLTNIIVYIVQINSFLTSDNFICHLTNSNYSIERWQRRLLLIENAIWINWSDVTEITKMAHRHSYFNLEWRVQMINSEKIDGV